jgi:hypothetical protein
MLISKIKIKVKKLFWYIFKWKVLLKSNLHYNIRHTWDAGSFYKIIFNIKYIK